MTSRSIPPGVAAGHPATAATGIDVLEDGGNAVDAAVAMLLTSCVAETVLTGLGGGGFATYYDAEAAEITCVDFFVAVPGLGGKRPGPMNYIEFEFGGAMLEYTIGAASAAVPGNPRGAEYLHRRWGRMSWRDVVAPALEHARRGVILTNEHKVILDAIWSCMGAGLGDQIHRNASGEILSAGEVLHIPGLSDAFERLSDHGADDFYTGEAAQALLVALDDGGIDQTDLRAYDVIAGPARQTRFGGATVHARGDDLDDILGVLARLDRVDRLGEAFTDSTSALALVDALRAAALRTETTNLVAVDPRGNACVVTSSLGLGAGVWVPSLGIHPNSMLGETELVRPGAQPGSRMGSMMSPLLAMDSAGPVIAAGAAGGSRIRSSLVQTLIGVLVGGRDAQSAIVSPRLNPVDDVVRLEAGFSPAVLEALGAAGERVVEGAGLHPYFGGVSAISRLGVGADPRRGGLAIPLT